MNLTMYPTDISGNTDDELKKKSGFAFYRRTNWKLLLVNKIAIGYKFSYTTGRLNVLQTGFTPNFIFLKYRILPIL